MRGWPHRLLWVPFSPVSGDVVSKAGERNLHFLPFSLRAHGRKNLFQWELLPFQPARFISLSWSLQPPIFHQVHKPLRLWRGLEFQHASRIMIWWHKSRAVYTLTAKPSIFHEVLEELLCFSAFPSTLLSQLCLTEPCSPEPFWAFGFKVTQQIDEFVKAGVGWGCRNIKLSYW